MRKILIIIIILVILATLFLVGYLAWQYFNKSPEIDNQELSTSTSTAVNLPVATSTLPIIKQLTATAIASYWSTASSELFLVNYNGSIEKKSLSAEAERGTVASQQGLRNISQLQKNSDGRKILLNLTIYDSEKNLWMPLPAGTTAAAWHPTDTEKVIYLKSDGLYLLSLKDGKSTIVLDFNNRDWQLTWPFAEEIYLTSKPSSAVDSEIWLLNLDNKTLRRFLNNQLPLWIEWSPSGQWGLRSDKATVVDRLGKELVDVKKLVLDNSFIVLPHKCLIVEQGFYCAVPRGIEFGKIIVDDYLKRKLYTNDDIYFISIDFAKRRAQAKLLHVANDATPIDAQNLSLVDKQLLFINRYNQRLYSLALP